ncbi:MAG TPA: TonB-dependent receptor [Candidatus Acidoferrum sp.]|nr:TonB-dependent receptor [Candidatus Acidoferrum sp.]
MSHRLIARIFRIFLFAALIAMASASRLHAQNSQVSGQILDPSGAAISNASVTLTRAESGDRRIVASGPEGYYAFPLLLPGHYELKVEKDGFQAYVQTGIVVETGAISSINVALEVGAVTEDITVNANPPQLQTESAAVSAVVENASITNLPLIDRRSQQLQRLNGFVVQTNSGANASFAIAGGRSDNANYFIDGGTAQNLLLGVPTAGFDPPVESVQEFNVALSDYAAELGRSGGGVVQMTTRSGTNSFHGSAYEYFRNNGLQAVPDFAKVNPALHYNLFGASLGGPIKKGKTQFFFNYEGRRQVIATPQSLAVPSAQELTGNFNGIIDPVTHAQVVIKNPATGLPFATNQIPSGLIDSVGQNLAAFYPHINGTSPTVQFVVNDPAQTGVDDYVGRIDHVFSEKDRIFGRLLGQTDHTRTASVYPTPGADPFAALVKDYNYNASGTWLHNFSPNKINELRITYTRRQLLSNSAGANTTLDSQINLQTFNTNYFPTVFLAGLQGLGPSTYAALKQSPAVNNAYDDNFSWVRGAHQIKFGGEVRTSYMNSTFPLYPGGFFQFNNDGASTNTAAGSIVNLLLGNVYTATIASYETIHSVSDSYAGFIQDDWKVTRRLTLNLGLRYDVDSPRWTDPNRQNSFNPTAINPVSGTPGIVTFSGINGVSRYANDWDLHNLGPRIGFAYSPHDNWVVRGGFAILYTGEYASGTPQEANLGYGTSGTAIGIYNSGTGIFSPAFELNAVPQFWFTPTLADLTPGFGAAAPGRPARAVVTYWDPNHVNGYIYQTSLSIQRQLSPNLLLDISYVGTFGHKLPVFSTTSTGANAGYSINQVPDTDLPLVAADPAIAQSLRPFPQFQNVQILDPNIGASKYDGVNVGLEKRYSQGFQFEANYTYSRFEDNADSYLELANYPGDNSFTDYYNPKSRWGLSGSDLRNRLILSGLYELPFGEGKRFAAGSGAINEIIGGWSFGTIAELHTGTPLSAIDAVNNTGSFSDGVRPNLVGNPVLPSGQRTISEWFNTAAFQQNPPYTFGDAPRTFGTGPGTAQIDASLLKNFSLFEKANLQFRAEALNVINHANLANPNTIFGNPLFGRITALQPGNQSRIIQLGLHLTF